jgi:hypothetical protein
MQKKTKLQSLFTRKETNTGSAPLRSQSKTDTRSANFYQSIQEIPLRNFIDAQVNQNISALIISGFPDKSNLIQAWNDIQDQFAAAIGDNHYKLFNNTFKKLVELKTDYSNALRFIKILKTVYVKKFADELNIILSAKFNFDYSDLEKYQKEISRAENICKGIKINIDLKQIELDSIKAKSGDTKPTREYYLNVLIACSNHVQFRLDDSITTYEFCKRLKDLNEFVARNNKK